MGFNFFILSMHEKKFSKGKKRFSTEKIISYYISRRSEMRRHVRLPFCRYVYLHPPNRNLIDNRFTEKITVKMFEGLILVIAFVVMHQFSTVSREQI